VRVIEPSKLKDGGGEASSANAPGGREKTDEGVKKGEGTPAAAAEKCVQTTLKGKPWGGRVCTGKRKGNSKRKERAASAGNDSLVGRGGKSRGDRIGDYFIKIGKYSDSRV